MSYGAQLSPVSTSADWSESVELTDGEDGTAVDLSAVDEITISVRDPQSRSVVLTGTYTGGEITLPGSGTDGVFQWEFAATSMGALDAKTYEVGVTLMADSQTIQLLIGTVPVLDGIVGS
jgi:hypothetical protein